MTFWPIASTFPEVTDLLPLIVKWYSRCVWSLICHCSSAWPKPSYWLKSTWYDSKKIMQLFFLISIFLVYPFLASYIKLCFLSYFGCVSYEEHRVRSFFLHIWESLASLVHLILLWLLIILDLSSSFYFFSILSCFCSFFLTSHLF